MNQQIPPDQARALGLDRQVLSDIIAETALDERTRKLAAQCQRRRDRAPDHRRAGVQGLTGQFDRSRFEQVLRSMGYSEARYLAEQRRTMLRQQLIGTISGDAPVPKTALEAFNRFQNEERSIEYVTLGAAQAGDIADPTPEVLAKYFEERKVVFRAPEYRKLTIVTLRPEDLAAQIEVSDEDLKDAYGNRRARYETPERRHLEQIVFPNMEEAKAASDKLAQGTTFEALAAERGLKDTDIDLGTVAKSAVVDRTSPTPPSRSSRARSARRSRAGSASPSSRSTPSRPARSGRSRRSRRDQARHPERARQERDDQRPGEDRGRAARRRDAGRRGAEVRAEAAAPSRRSTATARMPRAIRCPTCRRTSTC